MAGSDPRLTPPPGAEAPRRPSEPLPAARRWRLPILWRGRAGRLALLAALLLHALVGQQVGELIAPIDTRAPPMQRIRAAYTRRVAQAEPPAPAANGAAARPHRPAPPPRPGAAQARSISAADAAAQRAALRERALAAVRAALAASAAAATPEAPASARGAAGPASAAGAAPGPVAASDSALAASAPAGSAASAAMAAAEAASAAASAPLRVETPPAGTPMITADRPWPTSTRLSYALHGWYNGDVYGQAQVEWLREGWRYQVHLDVAIGPRLAPLVTRRMSSEGRISDRGLVPRRYQQVTQQIIGRTRTQTVAFEDSEIVLERGNRIPQQAQVQDTASQFIQMIYLFTAQPALREAGRSIEFPLALPHRVDRWTYDVGASESLDTPVGQVEAFHVKPRRVAAPNSLSIEVWYAPRLQLLPVRIFIRQDEQTWVDLLLEKAPEQ